MALWTNRFSSGLATDIAVDSSGNVFVTGDTYETIAYSNDGTPLWTNRYQGPEDSWASALSVGINGSVFVAGSWTRTNDSGYATVAYSKQGLPLWTNSYGLKGSGSQAKAIAVDNANGKIFVTGFSHCTNAPGCTDYATVAYSVTGSALWTNRFDGPANYVDYGSAVAVNASGTVFVTGFSWSGTSYDYATVAYSGAGRPLWTNYYDGPRHHYDEATAVAVDREGNVIVTGYSQGTNGADIYLLDYATIKYSPSGIPLWTNRYDSKTQDYPSAIAVNSRGDVFVSGQSRIIHGGSYATVAYSSAGTPLWTNWYHGPGNSPDYARAIAIDRADNVFVTGESAGTGWGYEFATVAYSSKGTALWTNRYSGPGNTSTSAGARAIAVDHGGNVFVTGESRSTNGYPEYTTIKYSSSIPTAHLSIALLDHHRSNLAVLTWTNSGFALQAALAVSGIFTNVPGATSPYTNVTSGFQRFFRLEPN